MQLHTEYSDGTHSVREMAAAADERGPEYVLVTDHGPHAPIPSTLDSAAFDEQRAEIEAVDDGVEVTILQGVEAEITENGLEIPPEWYEACDLVVAGIHSRPSDPTEQVIRALEEFPVDVLAHPINRLINERDPLELDLDAVARTAARENVALEINGQPERLDLVWQAVKEHRDTVAYVVSTDAHTTSELDFLHLGVSQARRGWCEPEHVLNTRSLSDLLSFFGS
ncbi:PHP domain-containing protein [Halobellus ordinarius]|uniref:PHP domain-containing protein n=1 Tax=Halobellus ordinarius TaxID=3075120 RepID=UPI00288019A6|nr:PHP domain-containing protein [Halobellus sp. ZY16]